MTVLKDIYRSEKILYLPIEIHSREIHARLFLAHAAVSQGWAVIIGPRYEVSKLLEVLPHGLYLGIGFHTSASKIARRLADLGHVIVSLDEEGMVRLPPAYYREYRVDQSIFDVSNGVLCWSEAHHDEVKELAKCPSKLSVMGNPRLDILSLEARPMFASEEEKIKNRFGEFVLINSSFGTANNLHGIEYWREALRKRGWFDNEEKETYQNRRIEFQGKIFEEMKALAVAIAKEGLKIVVRPHPSESIATWKTLEKDFPENIFVVREGNVIPWMLAAQAIIHNGCTTAIEGRLLDKPIISYRPIKDALVESELANSVGTEFANEDKLVAFLKDRLGSDSKLSWPEPPALNRLEIWPSSIEDNFATRFLSDNSGHAVEPKELGLIGSFKCNLLLLWIRFKLHLSGKKNKKGRAYEEQKCPKVTEEETRQALADLATEPNTDATILVRKLTNRSVVLLKEDSIQR